MHEIKYVCIFIKNTKFDPFDIGGRNNLNRNGTELLQHFFMLTLFCGTMIKCSENITSQWV